MLRILYGLNAGLGGAAVGRGFRSVAGLRTTGGGDALDVVQTRIGHLFVQILKMQTKLWISEKKKISKIFKLWSISQLKEVLYLRES